MINKTLFLVFFLTYACWSLTNNETENINTTKSTEEPQNEQQDAFLLEIDFLKKQIDLTNRKIELIEQLRTYYIENNQTIPTVSLQVLNQTISIDSFQQSNIFNRQPQRFYTPIIEDRPAYPVHDFPREKSDFSLMNKIFKKFTLELNYTIQDMLYLPTKATQRAPDEASAAAILVFLTSDNEIVLYNLNGIFLLKIVPGHKVKKFGVNTFTDEYFVVTLGTDNTIRLFSVNAERVKVETAVATEKPKKVERPKFVTEYSATLEYIYDLESHRIITEEQLLESASNRKERGYSSITSILGKSNKFLALGDENGALLLINRNGTYKGKFTFPDSKFVSIQKHYPNPIFATDKSVGFFNPNSLEIIAPHCDLPGETVLKVEIDQFSSNDFFVLTQSGDILFYELKHQGGNQCKVVAKRSIPLTPNSNVEGFNVHSSKSFIFLQDDIRSPNVFVHNITDVVFATIQEIEYHNLTLYPFKNDVHEVVKSGYMTQRSSFISSFTGTYFEFVNGTSVFVMYELTINQKPPSDWLSNFRIPIVFIAVILAIGYQFWTKRRKRDDDEAMETLSKFDFQKAMGGAPGKKFGGRDLNSLKGSLDSLSKQTSRMQDDLDSVQARAMAQINSMKGFKTDSSSREDNVHEISTKKYI